MSILSGVFKKFKDYILIDGKYVLSSRWTKSDAVIMGDGTDDSNTLEKNLGSVKGITDSLTATSSNVALSAAAGKNLQDQLTSVNSNLESLSSFYIDADSQLLTISGIDSGAIQITPPQRDGYEVVAAIIRTTSGENSSYLVANITTSGWLSCCNCKNITVDVVFTVRFFYRKIK